MQPNAKNQINIRKQDHPQIKDGEHFINMNFKNERNLYSLQNSVDTVKGSERLIRSMQSRSDAANNESDPIHAKYPINHLRDQ